MARKNKGGGGGGGSWLDTYADMVTLLLTFFVMLFSMSNVEQEKWEALVRSFTHPGSETHQVVVTPEGTGADIGTNQGSPGGEGTGEVAPKSDELDFASLFEYLEAFVKENNLESSVEINEGESSVYIRFSNAVFFNPDSYTLRPDSNEILNYLGDALKQVEKELTAVMIAGHTAFVDGPYGVNDRMLASERAANVAIYFEKQKALDPTKLMATGYGANFPVADNKSPQGREKNRRVEFLILSNKADVSSPEVMEYVFKGTYDETKYPAKGGADNIVLPDGDKDGTTKVEASQPPVSQPPVSQPEASLPAEATAENNGGAAAVSN